MPLATLSTRSVSQSSLLSRPEIFCLKVEDDVTNCKTEQMVKCREVTEGYITRDQCEEWPVQRCSIERKLVKKYTPETKCWSEPKEICGAEGCGFKNVSNNQ